MSRYRVFDTHTGEVMPPSRMVAVRPGSKRYEPSSAVTELVIIVSALLAATLLVVFTT